MKRIYAQGKRSMIVAVGATQAQVLWIKVYSVFYTLGRNYTTKGNEMTQVDIKRFLFVEFKESHLKNEPIRRKEPT